MTSQLKWILLQLIMLRFHLYFATNIPRIDATDQRFEQRIELLLSDKSFISNLSIDINPKCIFHFDTSFGQGCIAFDCKHNLIETNTIENHKGIYEKDNSDHLLFSQYSKEYIMPYRGLLSYNDKHLSFNTNSLRNRVMRHFGTSQGTLCYVSNEYLFVYVHVLKSGGSSMKGFLRNGLCGVDDIHSSKCANKLVSMPCNFAKTKYASYFWFTTVRNPFDRAFSIYAHSLAMTKNKNDNNVNNDGYDETSITLQTFDDFVDEVSIWARRERNRIYYNFVNFDQMNDKKFESLIKDVNVGDISQQLLQYLLLATQKDLIENNYYHNVVLNNSLYLLENYLNLRQLFLGHTIFDDYYFDASVNKYNFQNTYYSKQERKRKYIQSLHKLWKQSWQSQKTKTKAKAKTKTNNGYDNNKIRKVLSRKMLTLDKTGNKKTIGNSNNVKFHRKIPNMPQYGTKMKGPSSKLSGLASNHFFDQTAYIFDSFYCPTVDYIARLETIDEDIVFLLRLIDSNELNQYYEKNGFWKINTFGTNLRKKKATRNQDIYHQFRTDSKTENKVVEWFLHDFALLGYDSTLI